jgi:myo-inositol-1-phosphate synthase
MKSPHTQRPDDEAREATEKFIAKYAGKRPVGSPQPRKRRAKAKPAAKPAPAAADAS